MVLFDCEGLDARHGHDHVTFDFFLIFLHDSEKQLSSLIVQTVSVWFCCGNRSFYADISAGTLGRAETIRTHLT